MVTNVTKSSITLGTLTKTQVEDFILCEDSSYLLQESADKLILEQSELHPVIPNNISKSSVVISMITKS